MRQPDSDFRYSLPGSGPCSRATKASDSQYLVSRDFKEVSFDTSISDSHSRPRPVDSILDKILRSIKGVLLEY